MSCQAESHFEKSLQQDIEDLKCKVLEMARLDELALQQGMEALYKQDRQLAFMVILRDRMVDELEIESDQLCIRFLIRHQPVAGHLRFVYSVIKIIGELERVGDYGESIARQAIYLIPLKIKFDFELFKTLADVSITMFHKAMDAFIRKDATLSMELMEMEEEADKLRNDILLYLLKLRQKGLLPLKALGPLMTIARRLERVADQARNFCEECLYVTTGEMVKHKATDVFQILFVDKKNGTLSQMAEGIGRSMKESKFVFSSAGLTPEPIKPKVAEFMAAKGIDLSTQHSKSFEVLSQRQQFQVIVLLGLKYKNVTTLKNKNSLVLDWPLKIIKMPKSDDPNAELEQAFLYLQEHIRDLVAVILGRGQQAPKI